MSWRCSARMDDCLEMVTGEMPQRTNGKEMKWRRAHLAQLLIHQLSDEVEVSLLFFCFFVIVN